MTIMVAPKDFLRDMAGQQAAPAAPVTLRGALDAIRSQHGKGARAYLAALTGVSPDTAGRWLSGKQSPSPSAAGRIDKVRNTGGKIIDDRRKAESRKAAAAKIRNMRSIRPRMVSVSSKSPVGGVEPDGMRQVSKDIMLGEMSDMIADAWERGDEDGAADLLSQAMMAGYAGESVTDDSGLAALLSVTDFSVTPDVTFDA
jgi:transcriptional regulator with XRE-family HTH domain